MALDRVSLAMIAPLLRGASVLCLGYPEIAKTVDGDRDGITRIMSAGAMHVDVVDVVTEYGCERIVDLNEKQDWPREYDLVINPGTIEHCWDISAAFFNSWRAVKVGGSVLHASPMTMINHGFWNISPTAFADFCHANGGEITAMRAISGKNDISIAVTGRCQVPPESVIYALMRKVRAVPDSVPVQHTYRMKWRSNAC